ncbi:MAG: T9SS type A sorting domain-containing protein [Bacteroidota bacterium]
MLGQPAGGTFSGAGIIGNDFDPGLAGSGAFTITYTFTDSAGCSASTALPVDVDAAPQLSPISGASSAQPQVTYFYTVIPTNASTYAWSVTGGTLLNTSGNAASVEWGFTGPLQLTVVETNANGCQDTATLDIALIPPTSVVEAEQFSRIAVFPNPTRDQVRVRVEQHFDRAFRVRVLASSGQEMYHEQVVNVGPSWEKALDIQHYASGVYLVQVITERQVVNRRLVVH